MTTHDAIELAETAVILARLSPTASAYRTAKAVAALARLGSEAHTWAERLCNFGEPSEGADSRKRDSISRRAFEALSGMHIACNTCKVEIHGDPRGSCLQISIDAQGAYATAPSTLRF